MNHDTVRDCNTLIVVSTQAEATRMNYSPIKAPSTLYVSQLTQLYGIRVGEAIDMVHSANKKRLFWDWWYHNVLCRVAP